MERADILRGLAAGRIDPTPQLAAELDIPAADLLVVAGKPVPAELLPPERDAQVMRDFARRAGHCDHAQLAALADFVRTLPYLPARRPFTQPSSPYRSAATTGFGAVLNGLIRNRGFGVLQLPFMGLSHSTVFGMVNHVEPSLHRPFQLRSVAGLLGWALPDLFAVADEPCSADLRPLMHCHHFGQLFLAAVPLTTGQLVETALEADRLRGHERQGAWQPVSQGFVEECPDLS